MEKNKTWAYTILSNSKGRHIYNTLHDILIATFTAEDFDKLSDTFLNEIRIKKYIDKCYNTLVSYAFKTESRVGFQVLGVFLMEYGGKITYELKKLILKYSKWKDDRKYLENKRDRNERKKYLFDFKVKIIKYENGNRVKILDVIMANAKENRKLENEKSLIWLPNIDFTIPSIEEDIKDYFNLNSTAFEVNNLITLKLEGGKTFIFINKRKFIICKHVLIDIPISENIKFKSIDELINKPINLLYNTIEDLTLIPIDLEFWAHCSNIQVWAEHHYDSRLLHSNLSFPLLKRLVDEEDPMAKKVFKEEIIKRFESGHLPVIEYLFNNQYIKYLNKDERLYLIDVLNDLIKKNEKKKIFNELKEIKSDIVDYYLRSYLKSN